MNPVKMILILLSVLLAAAVLAPQVTAEGAARLAAPHPTLAGTAHPGQVGDTPTPTATDPPPTEPVTEPPATPTPTATEPPPTPTPTVTVTTQPAFYRPVVVLASYTARPNAITPGGTLNLEFQLANHGQIAATNVVLTFQVGELMPRQSGGMIVAGRLENGESRGFSQGFVASSALTGLGPVSLLASITYTDENGTSYSESISLAVNSTLPGTTPPPSGPARPTPTPTRQVQAQLVIQDTQTDVAILQPGTRFTLEMLVSNVGNTTAQRVTMIAGGGTLPPEDPNNPDPGNQGGVSASGGEFTNFSPLGGSNVQSLGDIPAGTSLRAYQPLIVNVTTAPGAYSFKMSFVYTDEKGNRHVDDQVITLLVYLLPVVEVSFYRDPGPLFAGIENSLPIQIINLGRKGVVLGNMRVNSPAGQVYNHTLLVGNLEAGGYFTLDAMFVPDLPGSHELLVRVDYNDDFNQPQVIERAIQVEVLEMPVSEEPPIEGGGGPGMEIPPEFVPETFWEKLLRILRGLLGLDSGRQQPASPGEFPGESPPLEGPSFSPGVSGPKG